MSTRGAERLAVADYAGQRKDGQQLSRHERVICNK
jgi:hypothetical protein